MQDFYREFLGELFMAMEVTLFTVAGSLALEIVRLFSSSANTVVSTSARDPRAVSVSAAPTSLSKAFYIR